jgi:hypothetical protein
MTNLTTQNILERDTACDKTFKEAQFTPKEYLYLYANQ